MKELSIEEKAKAYDEAIKRAKEFVSKDNVEVTEYIFPELKEPEDERIRKALIDGFKRYNDGSLFNGCLVREILAWLEKQGEQKPVFEMKTPEESLGIDSDTYNKIVDECVYGEQNPADKVKPKFHEGECITNGDYTWKIVEVKPLDYILQSQDGNIVDDTISHVDEQFHSFTIEDAKDGDVLATNDWVFIFKGINNNISCYCHYDYDEDIQIFNVDTNYYMTTGSPIYPATKEQRYLLFQKMHEAGYEWDADKLELKKIEQSPIDVRTTGYWHVEDVEQKPAWSEEDENHVKSILSTIECCKAQFPNAQAVVEAYNADIEWLKSLKDKVGYEVNCTTTREWSKEDEKAINDIMWSERDIKMIQDIISDIAIAQEQLIYKARCEEEINWLKSLKDRYTLKPSNEHYELEEFAKIVRGNLTGISKAVQELFEAKYLQLTGNKMYGGFKD